MHFKKQILFACFCFLSQPVLGYREVKLEGEFSSTDFVLNRSSHSINDFETFSGSAEFIYDNESNLKIDLKPRIKIDVLDSSRNRYTPNEAYLRWYQPHAEISAGQMLTPLGVAETYNPTDVLNRHDFEDNFYDPDALGEITIDAKYTFDKIGPFSEVTFRAIALPLFFSTPLPENDSRFAIAGTQSSVTYTLFNDQQDLSFAKSLAAAALLSAKIKNIDLEFLYYHGPERTPGFFLHINSLGALTLQPFYYDLDLIGSNVRASIGNFVVKFEAAYKSTASNNFQAHEVFLSDNAIPDSYFQFVGGFDYTVSGIGSGDLKFIAEYLGENNHSDSFNNYRPFKNDLVFGAQYTFNDRRLSEIKAAIIKDLANAEVIFTAEGNTKIWRELRAGAKVFIVGKSANPAAPLSLFDNNSFVEATLSYAWGKRW